ncbi:MAG: glycoside hydrolase family 5 protein [Lachnospiraceae bacterium]
MQNKKYLVIIAILAALLMGAVGVIAGMTMQQKMSADGGSKESAAVDSTEIVNDDDAAAQNDQEAEQIQPDQSVQPEQSGQSEQNEQEMKAEGTAMGNTPVERYGALQVKGNRLTDQNGNQVQLKGISTHGLSWYPQYVNEDFFRQMRDEWNVEVVRLAMYTAEYNGYCVGDENNKQTLKNVIGEGVNHATNLGMYVIIDWHILSDSNPLQNKEEAKKFFAEMAERYQGYDNVIYEICNEPNNGASWSDIKTYANEVIPVIREKDQDAIILVGTPNWSQFVNEAAADPITGYDNLMYVLHFYADTHRDDLRNTMQNAYNQGLPIFVSEFGICDASGNGAINVDEANKWIDLMDQDGISYCIWNLSNKAETSAFFKTDCTKSSGFTRDDLSDEALWYLDVLKK